jgi:Flp pilus assembly protein TadG
MKAGIKVRLRHEGGMALVWLALVLLILLILFASFAIDISFVYFAKNELQIAADAACLAGVAEKTLLLAIMSTLSQTIMIRLTDNRVTIFPLQLS